jgi:hypothetical protein
MMPPLSFLTPGTSIQEKSGRYPVAQTIESISTSLPSSKTARRPLALVSRFRKVTPECRRRLGLDPMSTSRFANFRPKRESVLMLMNPIPDSHQKRSLPSKRCGRDGTRLPTARSTFRVAASSSAIWKPELPPPTTST